MSVKRLLARHEIPEADRWDLSSLYLSDEAWETDFRAWEAEIPKYAEFQGRLGESAHLLAECLRFDSRFDRLAERLGTYAHLKTAEDTANSTYQAMRARYINAASRVAQAASYIRPEIMAIDDARMRSFLADQELALFRVKLERMLRYKPYTLSEREEKLLAMQTEMADTANQVFRQLNNADLKFGTIRNEKGELIELTHGTFSTCLHSPDREVRRTAFHQYYQQFKGHENTLAATLNGSIQRDIYYAKARGYESVLAASLFHDDVPQAVYDNLIATVRKHLPAVHRYYDLRRRFLGIEDIHQYDTYVPLLAELDTHRTWDEAVELVLSALEPLGSDYCGALERGLRGHWCDRYENQGKQSGAFSSGSFDGEPYILMNYQPQVLDHVFTLAHEAGHSMHSRYSAKSQPFEYYDYAIFVAEVASTFNEELLSEYMLKRATSDKERAYLINREIDDIRGTLIRQTMFAEFEKTTHAMAEAGEPLTLASLQQVYRELLGAYFGPEFALDPELSLECFRIPHFYRAFYVYKYATGMSAAIALSQRVLYGSGRVQGSGFRVQDSESHHSPLTTHHSERDQYLGLLRAGCSKYPLEILRDAGVDMSQPGPVETALRRFGQLVHELDELLRKPGVRRTG